MRRYSPREMSEILKLADELRNPGKTGSGEDYTLAEMQAVAKEMGLDPAQVALAASQYESGTRVGKKRRWVHQYVRNLPFAVSDSGWERLVDEMRAQMGVPGEIRERADGSREWTAGAGGDSVAMTVSSQEGGSQIDLRVTRKDVGAMIGVFWGLAFFMSTIMSLAISSKGGFTATDLIVTMTLLISEILALPLLLNWSSRRAESNYESLAIRLEAAALAERPAATASDLRQTLSQQQQDPPPQQIQA